MKVTNLMSIACTILCKFISLKKLCKLIKSFKLLQSIQVAYGIAVYT